MTVLCRHETRSYPRHSATQWGLTKAGGRPWGPLPSGVRQRAGLIFLMIVECVFGVGTALANEGPTVRLVSGDHLVWVYRYVPSEGQSQYRSFAYRRKGPLDGGIFVPVPLPPLRGQAVAYTTAGDDLHVFFSDGTHRTYLPIDMNWNDQAARLQIPQSSLPGNRIPLAVGGDGPAGLLYALVDVGTAAEIQSELEDEAREWAEPDGGTAPAPKIEPFALPETGFVVVRYEGTRWMLDRRAPAGLSLDNHTVHLMAYDGRLHLLEVDQNEPHIVTHRTSMGRDVAWSDPEVVPSQPGDLVLSVGVSESTPYVVLGSQSEKGLGIVILRYTEESWQRTVELRTDSGGAVAFQGHPSAALFGDFVVVAECDDLGQLRAGFWSASSGEPLTTMRPTSMFNRRWHVRGHNTLGFVLQYGLLGAVLAALFLVRRERFVRTTASPSVYTLARFDARLKALVIDVAVLAPCWLPVVTVVWLWEGQGLTLAERLALRSEFQLQHFFSTWVAVGCLLGLYGAIFESAQRTTLGKRLAGLKVVGEDHTPCRLRAIILRNVLRVIEFQFPPLAVLVLLTPYRQRVGDLFARTLVVEAQKKPTEESDSVDVQV